MMNKKVTFKDVAALAGVSTQTVSRVTNGGKGVDPNTLKKVQEAIDTLGYVPNKGAQLLVQKQVKVLGIITLKMSMEGAMNIVEGVRLESKNQNYSIALTVVEQQEENLEEAIRELRSQQVAGIVINLGVSKKMAETLVTKHPQISFLFIDVPTDTAVSQISSNHQQGAQQVVQHLLAQGHQHFGLLNGPQNSWAAKQRKTTWEEEIKKAKQQIIVQAEGNWTAESGYTETLKMLQHPKKFSALLVASDQMALGALRACAEQQIDVPVHLSVTGFDDTPDSAYYPPPLTTVKQNFLEIGKQAVKTLLSQIHQENAISKKQIDLEFVERQSTAKPNYAVTNTEEIKELLHKIHGLLPHISKP
ncbi:LacI family DNA-binding transcriptional regulator [Ochrovirga pacifica]|uniref:LacI family DNA-binding transcriptional regulator n=1 Tax=Ochrovirga pacifica TaxID=1042376 RepID=UPI000306B9A3|nr:LacI family DNA-binding transcriptional regulator [Ochrovirga pacifica]